MDSMKSFVTDKAARLPCTYKAMGGGIARLKGESLKGSMFP